MVGIVCRQHSSQPPIALPCAARGFSFTNTISTHIQPAPLHPPGDRWIYFYVCHFMLSVAAINMVKGFIFLGTGLFEGYVLLVIHILVILQIEMHAHSRAHTTHMHVYMCCGIVIVSIIVFFYSWSLGVLGFLSTLHCICIIDLPQISCRVFCVVDDDASQWIHAADNKAWMVVPLVCLHQSIAVVSCSSQT